MTAQLDARFTVKHCSPRIVYPKWVFADVMAYIDVRSCLLQSAGG